MSNNFQLDNHWHLHPIKGDTGNTFLGVSDQERVFIKRNSSPFLAILSREGITPKLVWTKRNTSGDVFTAQEWLDGRLLANDEVARRVDVMHILQHLHQSDSLKDMLEKVGGEEKTAFDFLTDYAEQLPKNLKEHHYLLSVFRYLEDHIPSQTSFRACHGDPIANNWLLADSGRLYLVDWDATILADPASDLGIVLGRYLPYKDWSKWLASYGVYPTTEVLQKVYWYSGIDFLRRIKRYSLAYDSTKMNQEIMLLKKLYHY